MVRRIIGVVLFAMMVSGCAHDANWLRRQEPVESTIGTDPSMAPAGRVIPPPGLGVDLGQAAPSESNWMQS